MRQLQDNGAPQLPPKANNGSGSSSSPTEEILQEMRQMGLKEESPADKVKTEPTKHLPQEFKVKYLGQKDASGLWGIKHTRRPVDEMVSEAKRGSSKALRPLTLAVSEKGVSVPQMPRDSNQDLAQGFFPIEVISYGVQDLVYTRVFAMIVVREEARVDPSVAPFRCVAFVCDSRAAARRLTFALADAFQHFSRKVKNDKSLKPKKFAIDLRSAEEMEAELKDSEA